MFVYLMQKKNLSLERHVRVVSIFLMLFSMSLFIVCLLVLRLFCNLETNYFQSCELRKESLLSRPSNNEFPKVNNLSVENSRKMLKKSIKNECETISVKISFLKKNKNGICNKVKF